MRSLEQPSGINDQCQSGLHKHHSNACDSFYSVIGFLVVLKECNYFALTLIVISKLWQAKCYSITHSIM